MNNLGTLEGQLDLALASELQSALLPSALPKPMPGHAAGACNRMCGSVGGDFYDFLRINSDQVAIVIGDVSGHGVRAALVMAQIIGWLRAKPELRSRAVETVRQLNRMLIRLGELTGSVTTCSLVYIVLDVPTGIAFLVTPGIPSRSSAIAATVASGR